MPIGALSTFEGMFSEEPGPSPDGQSLEPAKIGMGRNGLSLVGSTPPGAGAAARVL